MFFHTNRNTRRGFPYAGSEVDLAVKAQKELAEKGKDVSVVYVQALTSLKISFEYKEAVLPKSVKSLRWLSKLLHHLDGNAT